MKNLYPPRVDATPEEMARAMFALPVGHQWRYEQTGGMVYLCHQCRKQVNYPEALHRDGRCKECAKPPAN